MIEREATTCWDCPFAEKHDWSNEYDSGSSIEDCALGAPAEMPSYKTRRELGLREPPSWCKLRTGAVLVRLRVK